MMLVSVIIVAAGSAKRMGGGIDKQYIIIDGMPVIAKSIAAFESIKAVGSICVVVKPGTEDYFKKTVEEAYGFKKITAVISGGSERQDSVRAGLFCLPGNTDYVMIHDGARPYVSKDVIEDVLKKAMVYGSAVPAVPVKDTIKTVRDGCVADTLDRSALVAVQTPQCFKYDLLMKAYAHAYENGYTATDDAAFVEAIGGSIGIAEGAYNNLKITTPSDIPEHGEYRSGTGFDVHAFKKGRKLILGGTDIPYENGLDGHSDADVLTHAIMDALLGACALGDIGKHFPDSDESFRGISSLKLLEEVHQIIQQTGFTIVNVDSVIIAQQPKLAPYIEQMRYHIAQTLKISIDRIGIKATTTEKLGFTGREEGIAANAVAMVRR